MSVGEGESLVAISDAALLQRFMEGDEACFEALFERHYDMVYGVLFRLAGTRAEAEDLAQEVFLKLYMRPLRSAENVAGWLYRVAVNTGYNALRSGHRREQREQAAARDQEHPPTPETEVSRVELQREVRVALEKISPRAAKMLLLREMGFSYQELADIVDVAPGSVGKLLARARQSFEKAYRGSTQASVMRGERDAPSE